MAGVSTWKKVIFIACLCPLYHLKGHGGPAVARYWMRAELTEETGPSLFEVLRPHASHHLLVLHVL